MNNNTLNNRHIRVFISSTFHDMQDERDYLMKHVFPKLRLQAASNNVTLSEVDLRWGIKEEDIKTGNVVGICFNEIENCTPFFIGIVGNWYGTRPQFQEISTDVKERYAAINRYVDEKHRYSITEMEIQFGVLERDEKINAVFFINNNLKDDKEIDYPKELRILKEKIISNKQGYPIYKYNSPEDLGLNVQNAFNQLLELFPKIERKSVDMFKFEQDAFLQNLKMTYVPDEARIDKVEKFIEEDKNNLLLLVGDSGMGKSSFLADWISEKENAFNIVYHFVGLTGNGNTKEYLLDNLKKDIANRFLDELNISEFNLMDILNLVAQKGIKLVVVIDALNQLVLSKTDGNFDWLPDPPDGIKFIASTTTDDINRSALEYRSGTAVYPFKHYTKNQRKRIIEKFLQNKGKKLDNKLVERIAKSELCANTLALRCILEELTVLGHQETLLHYMESYIEKRDLNSLFKNIFERYEEDYGTLLVKKTLLLLAMSVNGLKETEILEILNKQEEGSFNRLMSFTHPHNRGVNQLEWSDFYCTIHDYIFSYDGVYKLSHQLIRDAVIYAYENSNRILAKNLRYDLIDLFKNPTCFRELNELISQYSELNEYKKLFNLINTPKTLKYLLLNDNHLLSSCLCDLCVYSSKTYSPGEFIKTWNKIDYETRKTYYNRFELDLVGIIVEAQGQWPPKNNTDYFADYQYSCIQYSENPSTKFHYCYSAGLHYFKKSPSKGIKYLLESASYINNENKNYEDIATCYNLIASWYSRRGKSKEEHLFLQKCIEPCIKQYGTSNNTLTVYVNLALTSIELNSYEEATKYYELALDIATKLEDYEACLSCIIGLITTTNRKLEQVGDAKQKKQYYKELISYYSTWNSLCLQNCDNSYESIIRTSLENLNAALLKE